MGNLLPDFQAVGGEPRLLLSLMAHRNRKELMKVSSLLAIVALVCSLAFVAGAQESQSAPAMVRKSGTVKSVNGNAIVLKLDVGEDVNVTVEEGARIVRVAPGETDLKSAVAMPPGEIQVGDRMLVRGKPDESASSVLARSIIVMKQADLAQRQQKARQDWQRRGTGGIVRAMDASAGTLTVAVTPTQNILIRTSKDTGFLRYAANSVKFEDARKSTFHEIKMGDQLRARGPRSADGKELAAEEVISGSFRNIAGTISGIDAGSSTITVKDVIGKKSVVVKLTGESQMRRLPEQLAQRIAFFLKSPEAVQAATAARSPQGAGRQPGGAGTTFTPNGGSGGSRMGGQPDFQQMINRLPAVTLADLKKEEAVMIVSTPGAGSSEVTAITLLSSVEPILTSNASGAAALLNGWNLSAPAGDTGPQ